LPYPQTKAKTLVVSSMKSPHPAMAGPASANPKADHGCFNMALAGKLDKTVSWLNDAVSIPAANVPPLLPSPSVREALFLRKFARRER
jgi:hypothetical protein